MDKRCLAVPKATRNIGPLCTATADAGPPQETLSPYHVHVLNVKNSMAKGHGPRRVKFLRY